VALVVPRDRDASFGPRLPAGPGPSGPQQSPLRLTPSRPNTRSSSNSVEATWLCHQFETRYTDTEVDRSIQVRNDDPRVVNALDSNADDTSLLGLNAHTYISRSRLAHPRSV
jgi:hypothetical protein